MFGWVAVFNVKATARTVHQSTVVGHSDRGSNPQKCYCPIHSELVILGQGFHQHVKSLIVWVAIWRSRSQQGLQSLRVFVLLVCSELMSLSQPNLPGRILNSSVKCWVCFFKKSFLTRPKLQGGFKCWRNVCWPGIWWTADPWVITLCILLRYYQVECKERIFVGRQCSQLNWASN